MDPQDFRRQSEPKAQDLRSRLTPEQMRALDERVAQDVLKWKRLFTTINILALAGFVAFLIWWKLS
jgi:hypothetical protein